MEKRYGPGEDATGLMPGDFILTHRQGTIPRLIRIGERRRYGSGEAYWSHAALIVGADGSLVEAESKGVVRSPLSKYRPREYQVVRMQNRLDEAARQRAVAYANGRIGAAFGYLVMAALSIWLLTGIRISAAREDHQICSGLVAHAYQEAGLDVGGDPTFMLPADLARRFEERSG